MAERQGVPTLEGQLVRRVRRDKVVHKVEASI